MIGADFQLGVEGWLDQKILIMKASLNMRRNKKFWDNLYPSNLLLTQGYHWPQDPILAGIDSAGDTETRDSHLGIIIPARKTKNQEKFNNFYEWAISFMNVCLYINVNTI